MVPVSRPCRTFWRSARWRLRQMRFVIQKAMGGAMKKSAQRDRDVVDRQVQLDRDEVVASGEEEHEVHRDAGHADGGAGRGVARAVEQVVLALVTGDPGLDERVGADDAPHDRQQQDRAREDVHAPREVAPRDELEPSRQQTQGAVGEAHVPVRLGASGDGGGVVGSVGPDRVDREEGRDQGDDAEHDEEEAAGLGDVDRHERVADDVGVGAARAGVLRVLVNEHEQDVGREQDDEDRRDEQDVHRVEARNDRPSPGKAPPKRK